MASPHFSAASSAMHSKVPKNHDDIFQPPYWRDIWAAVLFYVCFATFAAISGVNTVYLWNNTGSFTVGNIPLQPILISISAGVLCAVLLTLTFVILLKRFPVQMIKGCFIGTAALLGVIAFAQLFFGSAVTGGFMFLSAILQVVLYFVWRKRIPFSAVLMKNAVDIMSDYPATILTAFLTLFAVIAVMALFIVSGLGLALMSANNYRTKGYIKGTLLYSVFSIIWTSEVIRNVGVVTISGVFATRYFLGKNNPKVTSPTAESFKRASSYSFGSICFGSLIVAVIEFVKALVDSSDERNTLGGSILSCLLGMIENLVRYFNKYAYTQIAIYGKPYIESAKDTWELVKRSGVEAIINDNLVGTALGLGVIFIGFASETVTTLVLRLFGITEAESTIVPYVITAVASFILALFISNSVFSVINAGITTTFVCLAEDPAALQRTDPELYSEVTSKYGSIVV